MISWRFLIGLESTTSASLCFIFQSCQSCYLQLFPEYSENFPLSFTEDNDSISLTPYLKLLLLISYSRMLFEARNVQCCRLWSLRNFLIDSKKYLNSQIYCYVPEQRDFLHSKGPPQDLGVSYYRLSNWSYKVSFLNHHIKLLLSLSLFNWLYSKEANSPYQTMISSEQRILTETSPN